MIFRTLFIMLICLSACADDKIQTNQNNSSKMESVIKYNQLAKKYLVEKNLAWGEPIGSGEEGDTLYLSYETPFAEKKVLGVRVLLVNKKTGEVSVEKRR